MSSSVFSVKQHVVSAQHIREYPGATLNSQEDDLKLHVKQYVPQNQSEIPPGAITIVGAHANGYPKELYEPLWEELYQRLNAAGLAIRSIWIADAAHQGMSSVLNEEKLGDDPSWLDHARDLLHMINYFRDDMHRPIVGIGHSAGASEFVLLSLMHPRLLSSLILIEPVIRNEPPLPPQAGGPTYYQLSTFRRDLWPSRAAAASSFRKNPYTKSWDPRVLDRWIEHGLRDLPTALYPNPRLPSSPSPSPSSSPDPPVTLTTTKHQEVFTFLRPNFQGLDVNGNPVANRRTHPDMGKPATYPFYKPEPASALRSLPQIRPSVLYIFGGKSPMSKPDQRRHKMDVTGTGVGGSGGAPEGRVKEATLPDADHLLPFEAVSACADAAADWLRPEIHRWVREDEEWRSAWEAKSVRERSTLSEEWKVHVGGDPRGKGAKL